MKTIFDETKLGKLNVKNRIVRSATWEGLAKRDGSIPDELYQTYEGLAKGGVGMIITGFTSVSQEDFYFDGMMRLGKDELISEYKKLVDIAHKYDTKIIPQLALGAYYEKDATDRFHQIEPDQLSVQQIQKIISMFGDAARRAKEAGFDGVQIHAAHYFFLSRFISPEVNHRTDEYGCNYVGRSRILKEIIEDIKKKTDGLHITMKLNISDMSYGGLDPDESLLIAKEMERDGLDSIELSANGTSVPGVQAGVNEGYYFEVGQVFAKELNIPVILVGGHRSIEHMNEILNDSEIDFLSISRPLVREPNLIKRWQEGNESPAKCVSCNACYRTLGHQCIYNIRAS